MDNIKNQYSQHVMATYGRFDVAFVRGDDCMLYDVDGKEYLDLSSGIGVNSVGYAHPRWTAAVAAQASTLAHVSNLYYTLPAADLAARLCQLSGCDKVFFSNSGAEANEGMIKLARKYSRDRYGAGRETIVTLNRSFHGRTVTTLSATGQDVFHQHFFPFTEGFCHVDAGKIEQLEAMGDDVCAVMLEPVQGEGGVLPLDPSYLRAVETLCRQRDWLLLIDEVQTGIGRCGAWFAFQNYGVKPDVVSFAKGVAGGLPLGGFMAADTCSDVLNAGTHATTFGGNPICCAAALATLDIVADALPDVNAKGELVRKLLNGAPGVVEVRGAGLMLGVVVNGSPRDVVAALLDRGVVCLTAGADAVRLLPPLTIGRDQLSHGVEQLKAVIADRT